MDDEGPAEMQKVRLSKDPLPITPAPSRRGRVVLFASVVLGLLLLALLGWWLSGARGDDSSGPGVTAASTAAPGTAAPSATASGAGPSASPSPRLTTTSAPPPAVMPDVLGLTCLDGITVLRDHGVTTVVVHDASGRPAEASRLQVIVGQSTAAGDPVEAGATVTVMCADDTRGRG
jgi:hypothetical protein